MERIPRNLDRVVKGNLTLELTSSIIQAQDAPWQYALLMEVCGLKNVCAVITNRMYAVDVVRFITMMEPILIRVKCDRFIE